MKATNSRSEEDWGWEILPPYVTIVAVHEEHLRRRHTPKVYEEYMIAAAKYLAEQADRGAITTTQLMKGTNETWRWMYGQMGREGVLLLDNVRAAEREDTKAWQAVGQIALGLGLVLGAALVGGVSLSAQRPAPAPPPPATPVVCQATPGHRNSITGQLMWVNIVCR